MATNDNSTTLNDEKTILAIQNIIENAQHGSPGLNNGSDRELQAPVEITAILHTLLEASYRMNAAFEHLLQNRGLDDLTTEQTIMTEAGLIASSLSIEKLDNLIDTFGINISPRDSGESFNTAYRKAVGKEQWSIENMLRPTAA